jgi:hypothetical protein
MKDAMARLKSRGISIVGTATTAEEAQPSWSKQAWMPSSFKARKRERIAGHFWIRLSLRWSLRLDLVRASVAAVSVPVIATGGLMDGRDITAALKRRGVGGATRHGLSSLSGIGRVRCLQT